MKWRLNWASHCGNWQVMKGADGVSARQHRRGSAFRFGAILVLCLCAPLLLVSLGPRAPAVSLLWDWANALGYIALALTVLLFIYAGRPRAFPPFSGRFFANIHRDFGYIAFALVVSHIAIMLSAEPLLLEHLKLTAPLHMLAGLASAVVMLLLVVTSTTSLRRKLWSGYQRFRSLHAWLAISALLLVLFHVVGSGYYLNSLWKIAVCFLTVTLVLGLYLDNRCVHRRHHRTVTRLRDTSHYAHWMSMGALLIVATVAWQLLYFLFRPPG